MDNGKTAIESNNQRTIFYSSGLAIRCKFIEIEKATNHCIQLGIT
jgi:hypothetical protein